MVALWCFSGVDSRLIVSGLLGSRGAVFDG